MTDEQIIAYYKEHNKPDPWWWPPILMLLAIIIGPPVIALMFLMILWSFFEFIWRKIMRQPAPEDQSVADRLNDSGIRMIVGYDGRDNEASAIVGKILDKYHAGIASYDWSPLIENGYDIVEELPQQAKDVICIMEDSDTYEGAVSQIQNEKSPTTVYAIAICDDYYQFLTAFPLLDDWYRPTKVLNVEKLYQRVDEYMKEGTIYGDS